MALKMAESLADLHRMGRYNINRSGYYARPKDHNKDEYEQVMKQFGKGIER